MKKTVLRSILIIMALILSAVPAFTNKNGAPSGKSGSPLSNGQTCNSCHSGPSLSTQEVIISSDIPVDGYLDNTTYTITVTADAGTAGMSRAGFEASVEKVGSHQGSLTAGSGTQLKQGNFITHTSTSNTPSNGVQSWSFSWNSGTGSDSVTVYAAALFANGNSQNSGDVLGTASTLFKKSHVGLAESSALISLKASPNPVQNRLRLDAPDATTTGEFKVTDALGRVVHQEEWIPSYASGIFLDVSHWANGHYTGTIALETGKKALVRFHVFH